MKLNPSSHYAIAEEIAAVSHSVGAVNGAGVDHAATGGAVSFFISLGDKGTAGTLDAKVQWSADGSTGWTDDDGSSGNDTAITQLTDVGTAQLNVNVPLERFSRVVLTVGTEAVVASVTSVAGPLRHIAP